MSRTEQGGKVFRGRVKTGCFGLFMVLLFGGEFRAFSQASLTTILANGPVSNRLNVVVLSEGYTSAQLGTFLSQATNLSSALFSQPPFQEYQRYFNAFAISVPSNQSGSDHPNGPTFRDTYFNSTYDSLSDYIITIPPNSADTNYSHGQGKIDSLLQTFMPNCQLPVLLVNDLTPGGSDGFGKAAITYQGISSVQILSHESGHVLANLGDEYTVPFPGFPDTEEPNTTRETRPDFIKWKAWIDTNSTPIPTPPTAQYSSVVGLFQGAHYHVTNWYRPKLNCTMNSPEAPFCDVCSEALVLAIYKFVAPVDAFLPSNTNLSVSTTASLQFSLNLLQPSTHNVEVQWSTNAIPVPGATNTGFVVSPQTLGNGTHVVRASVTDNPPLVRNDPNHLLNQNIEWTLNINVPQLQLDSAVMLPAGRFAFRINGTAPQGFSIRGSSNLLDWTALITNSLVGGHFWYTNSNSINSPSYFFRAVTPP